MVRVELGFEMNLPSKPARQAFSILPSARAHFVYACPFGNCDGAFNLNDIALGALQAGKASMKGSLTCSGTRARHGKSYGACELAVTYSLIIRRSSERSVRPAALGAGP